MVENHLIFSIEGIEVAEGFIDEYFGIVEPLPDSEEINLKVFGYLNQLIKLPIGALYVPEHFEKLTDCPGISSIKIKRKGCNLRILFSYRRDGSILLHSFIEEKGKRKTDYSGHAPIASRRLKEYKGGTRHDKSKK